MEKFSNDTKGEGLINLLYLLKSYLMPFQSFYNDDSRVTVWKNIQEYVFCSERLMETRELALRGRRSDQSLKRVFIARGST